MPDRMPHMQFMTIFRVLRSVVFDITANNKTHQLSEELTSRSKSICTRPSSQNWCRRGAIDATEKIGIQYWWTAILHSGPFPPPSPRTVYSIIIIFMKLPCRFLPVCEWKRPCSMSMMFQCRERVGSPKWSPNDAEILLPCTICIVLSGLSACQAGASVCCRRFKTGPHALSPWHRGVQN